MKRGPLVAKWPQPDASVPLKLEPASSPTRQADIDEQSGGNFGGGGAICWRCIISAPVWHDETTGITVEPEAFMSIAACHSVTCRRSRHLFVFLGVLSHA